MASISKKTRDNFVDVLETDEKPQKEKTEKESTPRDDLISALEEIDKDYEKISESQRLPDTPVYERKEYDAPTDEEIKANAEALLEGERVSGIENIETQTEESKKAKEKKKAEALSGVESKKSSIMATYDQASENYSNDLLKRGMARSSVAVAGKNALEQARADAITLAVNNAEAEVKAIDEEISALETSRQKALDAFNIAHAVKVTEKIAELTKARDLKAEEVLEYNNNLLQQEMKEAYDKIMKESDLETEYLRQEQIKDSLGVDDVALSERNIAKYNTIRNYLLAMSREDAKNAVRTDELVRSSLTDYYYYKLYNEFS